jgi:hypothetical protein
VEQDVKLSDEVLLGVGAKRDARNLIQINVAPASNCLPQTATALFEEQDRCVTVDLRPLGWAAFFFFI